jgi:hypothetical protein
MTLKNQVVICHRGWQPFLSGHLSSPKTICHIETLEIKKLGGSWKHKLNGEDTGYGNVKKMVCASYPNGRRLGSTRHRTGGLSSGSGSFAVASLVVACCYVVVRAKEFELPLSCGDDDEGTGLSRICFSCCLA